MMTAWLSRRPELRVVGSAFSGPDGLVLCRKLKPDLALLDVEMPGMDGFEVARQLRMEVPDTRIIMVTSHVDPYCVHQIARSGVHGYVDKCSSIENLASAIKLVAEGKHCYAAIYHAVRETMLSQSDSFHKILTPKELAVLILLAVGVDDATIADRLDISASTAATHRRNLRRKLDAHNDRELIAYARKWGLVPLVTT